MSLETKINHIPYTPIHSPQLIPMTSKSSPYPIPQDNGKTIRNTPQLPKNQNNQKHTPPQNQKKNPILQRKNKFLNSLPKPIILLLHRCNIHTPAFTHSTFPYPSSPSKIHPHT